MSEVLIKKGVIQTKVQEKTLQLYLDNGWEVIQKEEPKEVKTSLDKYTKKQLMQIAKENKVYIKDRMTKKEIIEKIERNKAPYKKVNNDGFTDNLIK